MLGVKVRWPTFGSKRQSNDACIRTSETAGGAKCASAPDASPGSDHKYATSLSKRLARLWGQPRSLPDTEGQPSTRARRTLSFELRPSPARNRSAENASASSSDELRNRRTLSFNLRSARMAEEEGTGTQGRSVRRTLSLSLLGSRRTRAAEKAQNDGTACAPSAGAQPGPGCLPATLFHAETEVNNKPLRRTLSMSRLRPARGPEPVDASRGRLVRRTLSLSLLRRRKNRDAENAQQQDATGASFVGAKAGLVSLPPALLDSDGATTLPARCHTLAVDRHHDQGTPLRRTLSINRTSDHRKIGCQLALNREDEETPIRCHLSMERDHREERKIRFVDDDAIGSLSPSSVISQGVGESHLDPSLPARNVNVAGIRLDDEHEGTTEDDEQYKRLSQDAQGSSNENFATLPLEPTAAPSLSAWVPFSSDHELCQSSWSLRVSLTPLCSRSLAFTMELVDGVSSTSDSPNSTLLSSPMLGDQKTLGDAHIEFLGLAYDPMDSSADPIDSPVTTISEDEAVMEASLRKAAKNRKKRERAKQKKAEAKSLRSQ